MDDKNNSAYSRAPQIEDVIQLCKRLNEEKVEYVIIGGIAVILHGFVRGTQDIDLLINSDSANVQKIKKALSYLSDNAISEIKNDDVESYTVVRVADEFVIDLLAKACGVNYKEASQDICEFEIEGVTIPLASPEILIRTKDTVRPSDKMDVSFLKALLEEIKKK